MSARRRGQAMHEHHGPGGRIVRHVHPDGALEHGHDELTPSSRWRWTRERSYSTRGRRGELNADQLELLEGCRRAQSAYLADPLNVDRIAERRRAVVAAADARVSLAAIAPSMGITRQAVHRIVQLGRRAGA